MIERPLARATLARQLPPAGVQSGGTLAPEGDLWRNIFWARRVSSGHQSSGQFPMIKWILILLIIAAVASLLGMPALAGAAATGARILIGIVLIIFLLVVLGLFAVS
jgi:uncharacterized membrane protein YtjA (UPF0391 family)